MKKAMASALYIVIVLISFSCQQKTDQVTYKSPKGYNFKEPEKHNMPEDLLEISGIAFNEYDPKTVYAIQDEEGRLFYGRITAPKFQKTKFGKHGDYEDVAICNKQVFVLKSNGKLYTFPLDGIQESEAADVRELTDLLPPGEYESLHADPVNKKLYVLCKNCEDEKTTQSSTGYVFAMQPDGTLKADGNFKIEVSQIHQFVDDKKIKFRPSAMALNPRTGQWYIISAVNKMLVITDNKFTVTSVYPLNGKTFRQPEGMAFDKKGDLYISNEGDEFSKGNILEFKYFSSQK